METQSNPMSKSGIHNTTMCGLVGRGERLVMQYPVAQQQICNSATKYKLFFFLLSYFSSTPSFSSASLLSIMYFILALPQNTPNAFAIPAVTEAGSELRF